MRSLINTGSHNVDYEQLKGKESLIKTKKRKKKKRKV